MENYETLNIENGSYETTYTKKYAEKKPWLKKQPKEILSFIPGTITSIEVKVGQKVEVGDNLLSFNAMKMSNQYKSPIAGVIAKINVRAEDIIPKGVVLIEFK